MRLQLPLLLPFCHYQLHCQEANNNEDRDEKNAIPGWRIEDRAFGMKDYEVGCYSRYMDIIALLMTAGDERRRMNLACKHRQHERRTDGSNWPRAKSPGWMVWDGGWVSWRGNLELPEKKPRVVQVSQRHCRVAGTFPSSLEKPFNTEQTTSCPFSWHTRQLGNTSYHGWKITWIL